MRHKNTTIMIAAVASAFVLSNSAIAQENTIIGTWKGKYAESCRAVEDSSTEDFLKIGRKKICRYEGDCEITRQTKKQDIHEIQILCETEGEVVRDTLKIKVINRDQINIDGSGKYDRCT